MSKPDLILKIYTNRQMERNKLYLCSNFPHKCTPVCVCVRVWGCVCACACVFCQRCVKVTLYSKVIFNVSRSGADLQVSRNDHEITVIARFRWSINGSDHTPVRLLQSGFYLTPPCLSSSPFKRERGEFSLSKAYPLEVLS